MSTNTDLSGTLYELAQANPTNKIVFAYFAKRKRHRKDTDLVRFRRIIYKSKGFENDSFWHLFDRLHALGVGRLDGERKMFQWIKNTKSVGQAGLTKKTKSVGDAPPTRERLRAPGVDEPTRLGAARVVVYSYGGETVRVSIPATWDEEAINRFCDAVHSVLP